MCGDKPVLGAEETEAIHAWNFLDGWNPCNLPVYLAFHRVPDIDLLVNLLMEIRDALNEKYDD